MLRNFNFTYDAKFQFSRFNNKKKYLKDLNSSRIFFLSKKKTILEEFKSPSTNGYSEKVKCLLTDPLQFTGERCLSTNPPHTEATQTDTGQKYVDGVCEFPS